MIPAKHIFAARSARIVTLTLLCSLASAALAEDIALPPCEDCDTLSERSFVDVSHSFVSERFDILARWIDGFFGERRADTEAANSFVRVRGEQRLAESGEANTRLRVRGKIRLPLLNERLKLVFFDEDESEVAGESLEETETERENAGGVGLQYNVANRSEFRVDYRLGLRSGDQIRTGLRMRYLLSLGATSQLRLTEELYWQDTRGFGSKTVLDIEWLFSANQLLRLSNRFDFSENTVGVPWASVLSFRHAFQADHAIAYYLRAAGDTRPGYRTMDYGPGLLYRRNIWKKWLFFEIEPTYRWTRVPETLKHEGVASLFLRVEVLFSDKHRY